MANIAVRIDASGVAVVMAFLQSGMVKTEQRFVLPIQVMLQLAMRVPITQTSICMLGNPAMDGIQHQDGATHMLICKP